MRFCQILRYILPLANACQPESRTPPSRTLQPSFGYRLGYVLANAFFVAVLYGVKTTALFNDDGSRNSQVEGWMWLFIVRCSCHNNIVAAVVSEVRAFGSESKNSLCLPPSCSSDHRCTSRSAHHNTCAGV